MAMDDTQILAGMARNEAQLKMIVQMTEKQQVQIDEMAKGVASLTASFDAYKEDLDFAKQGRTMLREHTVSAEKQLQELRDMIKEHEKRIAVLEDSARQGTRDSEEGDNAVRLEMNKGFAELRSDLASMHSDIAEIKAAAGNTALKAWGKVISVASGAAITGIIGLIVMWIKK